MPTLAGETIVGKDLPVVEQRGTGTGLGKVHCRGEMEGPRGRIEDLGPVRGCGGGCSSPSASQQDTAVRKQGRGLAGAPNRHRPCSDRVRASRRIVKFRSRAYRSMFKRNGRIPLMV